MRAATIALFVAAFAVSTIGLRGTSSAHRAAPHHAAAR
jgi:hypothetical protein